jgi:hypothetical protein
VPILRLVKNEKGTASMSHESVRRVTIDQGGMYPGRRPGDMWIERSSARTFRCELVGKANSRDGDGLYSDGKIFCDMRVQELKR